MKPDKYAYCHGKLRLFLSVDNGHVCSHCGVFLWWLVF